MNLGGCAVDVQPNRSALIPHTAIASTALRKILRVAGVAITAVKRDRICCETQPWHLQHLLQEDRSGIADQAIGPAFDPQRSV